MRAEQGDCVDLSPVDLQRGQVGEVLCQQLHAAVAHAQLRGVTAAVDVYLNVYPATLVGGEP